MSNILFRRNFKKPQRNRKRNNLKLPTPIKELKKNLEYGNYPYFLENKKSYLIKLTQTIPSILESDFKCY